MPVSALLMLRTGLLLQLDDPKSSPARVQGLLLIPFGTMGMLGYFVYAAFDPHASAGSNRAIAVIAGITVVPFCRGHLLY